MSFLDFYNNMEVKVAVSEIYTAFQASFVSTYYCDQAIPMEPRNPSQSKTSPLAFHSLNDTLKAQGAPYLQLAWIEDEPPSMQCSVLAAQSGFSGTQGRERGPGIHLNKVTPFDF